MKRMMLILLCAALLCACSTTPEAPVVETDARVEETPAAAEEDVAIALTEAPTQEPIPEAATPKPEATEAPKEATYAQRVVEAWRAAGYLDNMAPYSEQDLLDNYGIDLSVCISGEGWVDAFGYTLETIVVEADAENAAQIKELLESHLAARLKQFESYDPEAYAITQKAVLLSEDGVVLMIVSPDAQAMLETFRSVTR